MSDSSPPAVGDRRPVRLKDVAAAAGVSPALASRVLNADPAARATDETRSRIVEAAARLGYVANIAARSLRASRTGLLGLVVHDLGSPIYLELLEGARVEAAANGYFLVLGDVDELLGNSDTFSILVSGKRVDGLIVQGGHSEFDERAAEIARALPTVLVNAPAPAGSTGIAAVYADEVAATRLLTEHLLDAGHRRFAFVSGPRESQTTVLRRRGVEEALDARGLRLADEDCVHDAWTAAAGRDALPKLLSRWDGRDSARPTALIAGNALIAVGLLGAAAQGGVSVPEELSIGAVHETWLSEHLVPSLTTVSLPLRAMGVAAVRRLLDASSTSDEIVVSEPAPALHVRASTRRLDGITSDR